MAVESGSFRDLCRSAGVLLRGLEGCFIERIAYSSGARSTLEVYMHDRPTRPGIVVSMERLWFFSTSGGVDLDSSFVDDVRLTYIPADQVDWPVGLEALGLRRPGMPDLAYLQISGPVMLNAVSCVVDIYVSQLKA